MAPALETKTALKENAIECRFTDRAWISDAWASDDDRTEKICALDSGRPDSCWAASGPVASVCLAVLRQGCFVTRPLTIGEAEEQRKILERSLCP